MDHSLISLDERIFFTFGGANTGCLEGQSAEGYKTYSSLAESDIKTIGWAKPSLWEEGKSEGLNKYSQVFLEKILQ